MDCVPSLHDRCENSTLPGALPKDRASAARQLPKRSRGISPFPHPKLPSSSVVSSSSFSSLSSSSSSSSCLPSLSSSTSASSLAKLPDAAAAAAARRAISINTDGTGAGRGAKSRVGSDNLAPVPPSSCCANTNASTTEGRECSTSISPENALAPAALEPTSSMAPFTEPAPVARTPTDSIAPSTAPAPAALTSAAPGSELPAFNQAAEPSFRWGTMSGHDFMHVVRCAYDEIVHWRRNVFMLPSGGVGKKFVRELTSLFLAYAQGSAMESVAIEAAMVASTLLLQKPHSKSKSCDHVQALDRRLRAWREGDIDGLLREGRTIQAQFRPSVRDAQDQTEHNIRTFSKLVFEGKIHSAIRFLSDNHGGGVLDITSVIDRENNSTVLDVLKEKHPPARSVAVAALVTTDLPADPHPVYFERLTGSLVRSAALRTQGAAGPSGIDAAGWRRLCTSFHRESVDLCAAIAAVARRLCTEFVDPDPLRALLACRLIPLDKQPGIRPIGICEVLRRIIGKAVMQVVRSDVLKAAGPIQLCGGHEGGCEAAVHAMREVFQDSATDGIIFVDASNAFNNLNRQVALRNIMYQCPVVAKILINCYRSNACLFVGGITLLSQEGTTQGDPLAMMMFALATVPLINAVKTIGTIQAWFADDAASGGRIQRLRQWWDTLLSKGPAFGYFPNAVKTVLLTKKERYNEAVAVFGDTGVKITTEGKIYLGGAFGSEEFTASSVEEKVRQWAEEVDRLANIAKTQPHAAFAVFTHGLIGRWTYGIRVSTLCADEALKPLEESIAQKLIPALTSQSAPADNIRALLALPTRLGGMGLINPQEIRSEQQESSAILCKPLMALVLEQQGDAMQAQNNQRIAKRRRKQELREKQQKRAEDVIASLPHAQQKCANAAQEKGTSAWLAAVPVKRLGFTLHKSAFWDAVSLRYGWQLRFAPQTCRCGANYEINHVMTCRQGGFHTIRHNDLRDVISDLLREVNQEVVTEPRLQQLSGERLPSAANKDNEARLDIRARGFWDGTQDAFFDVRVFHPFAPSYQSTKLSAVYRQHESKKRREYGDRVRDIEHGCFTPLVFTTSGGAAPEATVFMKRLASMLAEKRGETYSGTMGWLRCVIGFCLLRSSLRCLRASQRKDRTSSISLDGIAEAVSGCHLPC